jgi:hypothetical protein
VLHGEYSKVRLVHPSFMPSDCYHTYCQRVELPEAFELDRVMNTAILVVIFSVATFGLDWCTQVGRMLVEIKIPDCDTDKAISDNFFSFIPLHSFEVESHLEPGTRISGARKYSSTESN